MLTKLRLSGPVLILVAAICAIATSGVQAGQTDVGKQPASIFVHSEAGQNHVLSISNTSGGKFSLVCPTATFEGTTQGQQVNEATFTPTYSAGVSGGCSAFGVASQPVANGCKYTITGAAQPANTGLIDVVGCTSGKVMETKTAICTVDLLEQNGLSHVVTTNISSQEVTLSATLTGVTVRQTGAACPDGNNHLGTSGSTSGSTILIAREDKGGSLVTKHGHQYQELAQTGALTTVAST